MSEPAKVTPKELKAAYDSFMKTGAILDSTESKKYFSLLAKAAGKTLPDNAKIELKQSVPVIEDDLKKEVIVKFTIKSDGKRIMDVDIPAVNEDAPQKSNKGPVVREPGKGNEDGKVIQAFDASYEKTSEGKTGMLHSMHETLMALAQQFNSQPVPKGTFLSANAKEPGSKDRGLV